MGWLRFPARVGWFPALVLILGSGLSLAADVALSDPLSGNRGRTVTSLLRITNVAGLSVESLDLQFDYDPAVVTFLDVRNGAGLSGGPFAPTAPIWNDLGGTVLVAGTTLLIGVTPPEGGVLLELDFEIRNDAVYGTVTTQNVIDVRINETVTPAATPGNITVASPPQVFDLEVARVDPQATDVDLTWADMGCLGATQHQLLYGYGSQLPSTPGGMFSILGAVCDIGPGPSYAWSGTPDPSADPSGLVWWLVVATDGAVEEGSWSTDGAGGERVGPAAGGASGECAITAKNTANVCIP